MNIRKSMSTELAETRAPFANVGFASRAPLLSRDAAGNVLLRTAHQSADSLPHHGHHLRRWAKDTPDAIFLAERDRDGDWSTLTYREARVRIDRLSQGLLGLGLERGRPLACMAENSMRYALLKLAAMQVGIPVQPISVAYSAASGDFARLRAILSLSDPAAVYVPSLAGARDALRAALTGHAVIVCDAIEAEPADAVAEIRVLFGRLPTDLAALESQIAGPEVERRFASVDRGSLAKLLMTSGSTGFPKAVMITEEMLAANGAGVDALWPFLRRRPPVLVDWLPWSHTFGTNFNMTLILRHGGTLYIDEGRPVAGRIGATLRNLGSVRPTLLFNVPSGFDMLVAALEQDRPLAEHVFAELDVIFYAGAALTPALWRRLEDLSVSVRGERVPILSSLGSTETGPVATLSHWCSETSNSIGLPLPGTELKLVPNGDKLEMRVRGPSVTPGYWPDPESTAAAFDADGFFKLGDAVKPVDGDVGKGLLFDGRLSENFKLQSGTWVDVGSLRAAILDRLRPLARDVVVAGHDRDGIRLLLVCDPGAEPWSPDVCGEVARRLAAHNAKHPRSSRRIDAALQFAVALSVDAGEITDKGYINQRAVLSGHAATVARLFDDADCDLLRPEPNA